jgi:predicted nucleic acid-binding protein
MIFVDAWAWIALADQSDQYHPAAKAYNRKLLRSKRRRVTSDWVLGEVINYLYSAAPADDAKSYIAGLLASVDAGTVQLINVSPIEFRHAWDMRQKYHDKPDISFVDFTSMVVMQDLGIADVFTGDKHFKQVGLGFRLAP